MAADLPLIGRAEELEYLRTAVADHGGALLGGAVGVGKTRLAQEVAATFNNWHVAWARVTPAARELPLGGISGLDLGGNRLSGRNRPGLFSQLARELTGRARGRATLVVVDDAHLLDELSAGFIHYLVSTGTATVLLTVRSAEQLPSSILALSKDGLIPRLELQPLGKAEFAALAKAGIDGAIDNISLDRLWIHTAGNVLFLRELLADGLESGSLLQEREVWRWRPDGSIGPRMAELVADRVGRLQGPRRLLVELLAVGEPVGSALLEALAPGADLVQEERSGLITIEEHGRRVEARLVHPLFGEVIGAKLGALARRQLQRRLAGAVEEAGLRRRDDLLRTAIWRMESATATDAAFLLRAAQQARRQFEPNLALRLARASEELSTSFGGRLLIGAALNDLGRTTEAGEVLDQLVGTEPDATARQALARERAWAIFRRGDGAEQARHALEDAETETGDPVVSSLARGELALLLTYLGRFADVGTIGMPLAAPEMDDRVRLRALPAAGAYLVMTGQFARATELCDQLEPAAPTHKNELPEAEGWIWAMRANVLLIGGRVEEAIEFLSPMLLPTAPRLLGEGDLAYARTKLGWALVRAGQPEHGLRQLEEAALTLRRTDPNGCLCWCLSLQAEAYVLLDRYGDAIGLAKEAVEWRDAGFAVFDGDGTRARAWVTARRGEHTKAVEELLASAEEQQTRGQPAFALFALHDALRLGDLRAAEIIEGLSAEVEGPYATIAAQHASALRRSDPARLEDAAEALAGLGMRLLAAEVARDAALQWSKLGYPAKAAAAARMQQAHLRGCEASVSPSPRMSPAAALPAPLTRRELEIVSLAARALTNAEIASRLYLSVRTVESHLYAAYTKLGITKRSQLAAALDLTELKRR